MTEQIRYRRTDFGPDLRAIEFYLLAHMLERRHSMGIKIRVGEPFSTKHRAQDPDIGIAVQGNAINLAVETEALLQRAVECVVMRAAISVEQSAIDVK